MKKTILILILFTCCLSISGFSQKAQVGFCAGINSANQQREHLGKNTHDESMIFPTYGLVISSPIGKHFFFNPGVYYSKKGSQIEETFGNTVHKQTTILNYVEWMLNFNYRFGSGRSFWFVGAGPTISFLLPESRVEDKVGSTLNTVDLKYGSNPSDDLKGMDFGANGIAGYQLGMGLFLAVNFTYGIRNLEPKANAPDKLRNQVWGIRLGWIVPNTKSK
ncbi:MAG TPA: porin family protein [Chitinophagaceae bacterium]|nr:porin family protein [Chitinophagaceae bacterium]